MTIIAEKYPDIGLLPALEGLIESGREEEAYLVSDDVISVYQLY
jgi:hypothetical protein